MIRLSDYDIAAFDCDGVLLDSNRFKSGIFIDVLAANGMPADEIGRFAAFQRANFGMSRFRLFDAVAAGHFGPVRGFRSDALIADFSARCRDAYARQPETEGMRETLERARASGCFTCVVSGSDERELRDVLATKDIAGMVDAIYGSPASKVENLRRAIEAHSGDAPRVVFFGDAFADLEAADELGVDFVFVARYSSDRERVERISRATGRAVIETLAQVG